MQNETAAYITFDREDVGHVYSWGNPEKPLVVLLHGFMQTGASWQKVAETLAANHWVLAPDLLGHGLTPFSEGDDLSLESYVDQLRRLIDWANDLRSPNGSKVVAIVGYSLGGRIAALFAAQYPDLLDVLILESAGLGPQTEEERSARNEKTKAMIARLDESVEQDPDQPLEAFITYWEDLPLFASQNVLPEKMKERIRTERLANDPLALRANLAGAGQDKMPDVRPALANLNKPVLYLVGERDAGYTKIAQSLMRAWAEDHDELHLLDKGFVQVSVIPQAGHNIHLERPDEYALHVLAFLQRTL